MQLNGINIEKGVKWTTSGYKLTRLKGTLKPYKYYYYIFNDANMEYDADVILRLGTDEKVYLIEIDR